MIGTLLFLPFLALVAAPSGGDDVLCLADGRVFEGVDLERTDTGVVLHYEHGDVAVPDALVLMALDAEGGAYEPRTEEERAKYAEGLVPFEGDWISEKKRDRLVEQRREEARERLEEYRAHREWANRQVETDKVVTYEYTVPKHIFEDYRARLEAYFKIFSKEWKTKKSKTPISICFYGTRKEFDRTSGVGGGVLGYFKFVGDYDLNVYYDRLDPGETEDVMFHEVGHYLIKLIDEDFSYPHFPGESICEYYGASDWDPEKGKLTTGLIQEKRLAGIKSEIAAGEYLGLEKMITTERMFEHYSWGWSLMHFLMNDARYAKKFHAFTLGLARDKSVKRVPGPFNLRTVEPEEIWRYFREELGLRTDADVTTLEREWHAYVDSLEATSASGLGKAAVAAMREGRKLRAERLFREALDAGAENPAIYHRFATLLASKGEKGEAEQMLAKAIALEPLTAELYHDLGEVVGDAAEAKRLQALAKEMDPDADFGGLVRLD